MISSLEANDRSVVRVEREGRLPVTGRAFFVKNGRAKVILPSGAVFWCAADECEPVCRDLAAPKGAA